MVIRPYAAAMQMKPRTTHVRLVRVSICRFDGKKDIT
jgi:hypothetical protein